MASKSNFKIFLTISIPLILLALVAIWASAQLAPSLIRQYTLMNVPYAEVSLINVTGNGVYVKVSIIRNEVLRFTPINGWIEIIDTGQSASVNSDLVAKLPLMPDYISKSSVGIKGIIYGYLNGSSAYIAFFNVEPIHVFNSISIINFTYVNCSLIIYLNASLVVPAIIHYTVNTSLFTTYTHEFVFSTINHPFNISLLIPSGNHVVEIELPIRPSNVGHVYIYGCSMMHGVYYTLFMPTYITYLYPTVNTTEFTTFIVIRSG
ncbi:hypothetical protein [Caldivirga sp. UBA161]|uniref:hypothetical protein n=1 Tax=Caldivirga sp. UBA161 TaxID=1915569 RepID=UPI0025C36DD0|nr:hypothetical protein [Caldivirga sp. UBA161]